MKPTDEKCEPQTDAGPNLEHADDVTFPIGGPYTRTYGVDGAGNVFRENDPVKLDAINLQVLSSDTTANIVAQIKFVSGTSANLVDRFQKKSGSCVDPPAVASAQTIVVPFPVPATGMCTWEGNPSSSTHGSPFVVVKVRTLRV